MYVITNSIPEGCDYLSPNTPYEVTPISKDTAAYGGLVTDDYGDRICIIFCNCHHLDYGSWEVVKTTH